MWSKIPLMTQPRLKLFSSPNRCRSWLERKKDINPSDSHIACGWLRRAPLLKQRKIYGRKRKNGSSASIMHDVSCRSIFQAEWYICTYWLPISHTGHGRRFLSSIQRYHPAKLVYHVFVRSTHLQIPSMNEFLLRYPFSAWGLNLGLWKVYSGKILTLHWLKSSSAYCFFCWDEFGWSAEMDSFSISVGILAVISATNEVYSMIQQVKDAKADFVEQVGALELCSSSSRNWITAQRMQ